MNLRDQFDYIKVMAENADGNNGALYTGIEELEKMVYALDGNMDSVMETNAVLVKRLAELEDRRQGDGC